MAATAFAELALHLYTTGQYSDLEVRCKDTSFKVHKAVVCVQSEWLAKAVREGRFLEGTTNVIVMHEDNPLAIRAMLQFLYTGNYDIDSEHADAKGASMLSHLDVYAVAEMLLLEKLKSAVETKLSTMINQHFEDSAFPQVVRKAYDVSPVGERGVTLRQIVVGVAVQNIEQVFECHADFKQMMEGVAEFGADLSFALTHKIVTMLSPKHKVTDDCSVVGRWIICQGCNEYTYAPTASMLKGRCPKRCPAPNINPIFAPRREVHITRYVSTNARYLFQCTTGHLFERERAESCTCLWCDHPARRIA